MKKGRGWNWQFQLHEMIRHAVINCHIHICSRKAVSHKTHAARRGETVAQGSTWIEEPRALA